jgi:hypothetical protein
LFLQARFGFGTTLYLRFNPQSLLFLSFAEFENLGLYSLLRLFPLPGFFLSCPSHCVERGEVPFCLLPLKSGLLGCKLTLFLGLSLHLREIFSVSPASALDFKSLPL